MMSASVSNPKLVVVEDSDADFIALKRSLARLSVKENIQRFEDADEAFAFLQEVCQPVTAKQAIIVLLDLNLCGTDGRDFIVLVKQNQCLKNIPIVVFSTSSSPKDIQFAYDHGANGSMVKPVDLKEFYATVSSFKSYWLETNEWA